MFEKFIGYGECTEKAICLPRAAPSATRKSVVGNWWTSPQRKSRTGGSEADTAGNAPAHKFYTAFTAGMLYFDAKARMVVYIGPLPCTTNFGVELL